MPVRQPSRGVSVAYNLAYGDVSQGQPICRLPGELEQELMLAFRHSRKGAQSLVRLQPFHERR
jgi:hypothetical protein